MHVPAPLRMHTRRRRSQLRPLTIAASLRAAVHVSTHCVSMVHVRRTSHATWRVAWCTRHVARRMPRGVLRGAASPAASIQAKVDVATWRALSASWTADLGSVLAESSARPELARIMNNLAVYAARASAPPPAGVAHYWHITSGQAEAPKRLNAVVIVSRFRPSAEWQRESTRHSRLYAAHFACSPHPAHLHKC